MIIKTKKGMASLYLVAFTTLLFGILTMSFTRVMLSESKEASNNDLSQSAFDSALAGIEDAKTAIIMYNYCKTKPTGDINNISCSDITSKMEAGFSNGSCDTVSDILGNPSGEVEITDGANNDLNQAYTCVTIANDATDFRSILNDETSSRTIPIMVEGEDYKKIVAFELQWYSESYDEDRDTPLLYMDQNATYAFYPLKTKSVAQDSLPILSFELLQTDEDFIMYELDLNNDSNTGTDRAAITLYPSQKTSYSGKGALVTEDELLKVSNKNSQIVASTDYGVTPKPVNCDHSPGFRCKATIQTPKTYKGSDRAESTFLIRVSLPYGTPLTDFSVQPCTELDGSGYCKEYANWTGAQFIVDSTGRASTLYRRVTARIDAINTTFIYPDYAIQATGSNATIEKDFYVTNNCWSTDGTGNATSCANNGDAR